MEQIIKKLEAARIKQKLSYEEIAKKINSTRSTVYKALLGKSIPSAPLLLSLIDALDYDFKIVKKPSIENFIKNVNEISKEKFFEAKEFIPDEKIKGKWNDKINSKDKSIEKEKKAKPELKKDILKCENCTYQTLPSGIEILLKKCNNCKTKKKK